LPLIRLYNPNSATGGVNTKLLDIQNAETDNVAATVSVVNAGTGDGIFIDQNGNGFGLQIDSEATTAGKNGLIVFTGQGADAAHLQYSADYYTSLTKNPTSATAGNYFYRNLTAASTNSPLVFIEQDHPDDTQPSLCVQQDGTGYGIFIDQNGAGIGLAVDNDGGSTGIYLNQSAGNGVGINVRNLGSAPGIGVENCSTGDGIRITHSSTGVPIDIVSSDSTEGDIGFTPTRASDPTTPIEGQVWYLCTTNSWRGYDGSNCVGLGGMGAAMEAGFRTTFITNTMADYTVANSLYCNVKRDMFIDANGCLNTVDTGTSTSSYNGISDFYQNCTCVSYQCFCPVAAAGTNACTQVTCAQGDGVLISSGGASGNRQICYASAYCDFTPSSYEVFQICVCINQTVWNDSCATADPTSYSCFNVLGMAYACSITQHTSNAGNSTNTSALLEYCKISGTIYDIYCDAACLCQVANVDSSFIGTMRTCSTENGVASNNAAAYICMFFAGVDAQAEKCLNTVCITNNFCPSNVFVKAKQTGAGSVVYNVYDDADNALASDIPIGTSTDVVATCTDCIWIQIKQCSDGASCLFDWGYHVY